MDVVDESAVAMPKLHNDSELAKNLAKIVDSFSDLWESKVGPGSNEKTEYTNNVPPFDKDLAKQLIRPDIYEDLRRQVDDMLALNLVKIQMQLAEIKKKKKAKGKKKKTPKGPKKKLLPGEKIADLKGLDSTQMLSLLIDSKLVVKCRKRTMNSFIGDFNYLGSLHHNSTRLNEGDWEPEDPSIAQIRSMLTEYCIFPNGSSEIKNALDSDNIVKSVMLYGAPGTGKTLAVEIIANELGGLLIHITPEKVKGLFPGKSGPTILVHMIMTVARDPTMQPVIVYIDECEKFFTGGKKMKDKDGPARFKKDFLLYKNQALSNEHRCIIMGTTNLPEDGDLKDMKTFFDKMIYMPYPDYASRYSIWKYYLIERVIQGLYPDFTHEDEEKRILHLSANELTAYEIEKKSAISLILLHVDISTLANISVGYSAGAIARAVRSVVTERRIKMIKYQPLDSKDFIDYLSIQSVTYQDDRMVFTNFIKTVTGVDERRKKVESMIVENADPKGKKPSTAPKPKK